jgi:MoaA/NifB/PqqE/SkfB family radical SAM enzyme
MSLQVVTVESVSGCEVVGVYLTEKLAKVAVATFVESGETAYKKKLVKKDSEEVKKLVYVEDSKEVEKKFIYMTSVPFVMPVTGKTKKVKDPLAPKKSLSGFMLFSNDHRVKVKASHPEATFGEVGRLVGEAWKALTEKQRAVYTKRSETDKQRYLAEMEAYTVGAAAPVETAETEAVEAPVKKVRAKKAVVESA